MIRRKVIAKIKGRESTYLLLQETLDKRGFIGPHMAQGGSGLERFHPDCKTKTEGKDGAEDDEPALGAQPASIGGQEKAGKG